LSHSVSQNEGNFRKWEVGEKDRKDLSFDMTTNRLGQGSKSVAQLRQKMYRIPLEVQLKRRMAGESQSYLQNTLRTNLWLNWAQRAQDYLHIRVS
jgi:hypothetical protein